MTPHLLSTHVGHPPPRPLADRRRCGGHSLHPLPAGDALDRRSAPPSGSSPGRIVTVYAPAAGGGEPTC
ncbi:hypothetical protein [Streptomyces sp. bgisy100]|uniref:hypothetical protein n=1 Tax=Streptomyces sp. bgisy100 TaxID=3413783 RepID=UPI003D70445C